MAQNDAKGDNNIQLTGDATGPLSNISVLKVQGNNVSNIAPPQVTTFYDASGANPTTNVTIQDFPDIIAWKNSKNKLESKPFAYSDFNTYVNVHVTDNQTNYSITNTDVSIVLNGSTVAPDGYITFPQSSPIGRVLMFGNVHRTTSFRIKPYAGSSIDGYTTYKTLTCGGMFCCYDGTNWLRIGEHTQ